MSDVESEAQLWECSIAPLGFSLLINASKSGKMNADHAAEKARRRIFVMKHLSFLKIAKPIGVKCYVTFIECCFLHRPSMIHRHRKARKKSINSIIKLARRLGDCTFDGTDTLSNRRMKARCLRMFATQSNNPIFELDRLPSGHYWMVRARVALCSGCYRVQAIRLLNNL